MLFMSPKRWLVASQAPTDLLNQYEGMLPLLAQVLYSRGFKTPAAAREFLRSHENDGGQFLSIKGKRQSIDTAISRIRNAIKAKELIVVYGDFDADGVTSTALMVQTLKAIGANVEPYIPHRVDEGYGLNSAALADLRKRGAKLVITVDCGIRSVAEVQDGRAYGLDIIVTDHHSIGSQIPAANAVINPKLPDCAYSEDMLAGVGVAYRLAEALLTIAANGKGKAALDASMLLELVAIGTIADLAPMDRSENRGLVLRGLKALNNTQRPGLQALIEQARLKPGSITARDIGFMIGPRINAAGRLDSAMIAYDLLMTGDAGEARRLASRLEALNVERQRMTADAQNTIRQQLESNGGLDDALIFAGSDTFSPGIVGLVAGRLTEEFYRPAVIMEYGKDESRASCRSIPEFDITAALDECADLLVRHGGHAQAAGFTVVNENLPALRERLQSLAASSLDGQTLMPTLEIDAELNPEHIDLVTTADLDQLEPTGHHNSAPVFASFQVSVKDAKAFGKDSAHLRLMLARDGIAPIEAILWRGGHLARQVGNCVDIAYTLEINEWNERYSGETVRSARMMIQDFAPAGESVVVRG